MENVIIMSCNADQIPSKRSVGQEAIEEERRLLLLGLHEQSNSCM